LTEWLLEVRGLKKYYPLSTGLHIGGHREFVKAVDGVSFNVREGEVLSLVGESGCGKTTTGKVVVGLYEPSEGNIFFRGEDASPLAGRVPRRERQMVFQDPTAALNPRKTIFDSLNRPFRAQLKRDASNEEMHQLMEDVGLVPPEYFLHKYPHELSGGQKQRVVVAQAIALKPSFVVADEPVSSLDLSIRGQILNLLKDLQRKFNLSILFITHDLAVARHVSDRVAIMYLGKIVELADSEEFFTNVMHPYAQALLGAALKADPKANRMTEYKPLVGDVPSPINPPSGCRFRARCPAAGVKCNKGELEPELVEFRPGHYVACHICA